MDDTAYLIFDIESVPDGALLRAVNYPDEPLTPDAAIDRARAEALARSNGGSDFIPYTYHLPVALCVIKVGKDFRITSITCLDAPLYRPREIVRMFWERVPQYRQARMVTFNGRRFDIPLLELCAFRFGLDASEHFAKRRDRYKSPDIDLYELLNNKGASVIAGGLSALAKMIGKPGKMGFAGDQVLDAWRAGKLREINDYCLCDSLDTYFVFLRAMVIQGQLTGAQERELNGVARDYLACRKETFPVLSDYLSRWRDVE